LTQGIKQIHDLGTYHQDIKPDNLLLTKNAFGNYVLKLGDAGMSCLLPSNSIFNNATYTIQGTPSYIAPELFQGYQYSEKADVFSFGVTCHELLTGIRPIAGQFVTREPAEMQNLIQRMISINANNRPDIEQVISEMAQISNALKSKQDIKDLLGRLLKAGAIVGGAFVGLSLLDELFKKK
jgi:serine/threonine protein kinase